MYKPIIDDVTGERLSGLIAEAPTGLGRQVRIGLLHTLRSNDWVAYVESEGSLRIVAWGREGETQEQLRERSC